MSFHLQKDSIIIIFYHFPESFWFELNVKMSTKENEDGMQKRFLSKRTLENAFGKFCLCCVKDDVEPSDDVTAHTTECKIHVELIAVLALFGHRAIYGIRRV